MELKLLEIIYDPEALALRVESQVRDVSALNGLLGRFVTALSASDRGGSSARTVLELFAAMELATHYDQEEQIAFLSDLSRSFRPAVERIDSWLGGGR